MVLYHFFTHLLSFLCIPGCVIVVGNTAVNKTEESYILRLCCCTYIYLWPHPWAFNPWVSNSQRSYFAFNHLLIFLLIHWALTTLNFTCLYQHTCRDNALFYCCLPNSLVTGSPPNLELATIFWLQQAPVLELEVCDFLHWYWELKLRSLCKCSCPLSRLPSFNICFKHFPPLGAFSSYWCSNHSPI